jgi:hypothetical protein
MQAPSAAADTLVLKFIESGQNFLLWRHTDVLALW